MSVLHSPSASQEMAVPPEKTLLKRKSSFRVVRKRAARVTGLHGFLSGKARNSLLKNDSSVREAPMFEKEETKEEPVEVEQLLVKQGLPVKEDRKEPVVEPPAVRAEKEADDATFALAADESLAKTPELEDVVSKKELTDTAKVEPEPVEEDVPVEGDRKGSAVDQALVVAEEEHAADEKPFETASTKPPEVHAADITPAMGMPVDPAADDDKPVETPIESCSSQEAVMQDVPVDEAIKVVEVLPEPITTMPLKTITCEEEKELEHMSRWTTSRLSTLRVRDAATSDPIVVVLCNL